MRTIECNYAWIFRSKFNKVNGTTEFNCIETCIGTSVPYFNSFVMRGSSNVIFVRSAPIYKINVILMCIFNLEI